MTKQRVFHFGLGLIRHGCAFIKKSLKKNKGRKYAIIKAGLVKVDLLFDCVVQQPVVCAACVWLH